jgi:CubicO group peptidase (beta-lactamase class C family)
MVDAADVPMGGYCDPRFAPVREAFAGNFAHHGERGAAVCLSVDGRVVVDLCGGWADADRGRPWDPDTLVNVFSIGKAMAALCAVMLVSAGSLDVDAPISRYWPAFAAAGKADITLLQVLSHQAGLPAIRHRLAPGAMLDWPVMCDALAAEVPWWEPGAAHGYHVNTFGYLVGEVLRRVSGQPFGRFFRDRVAAPLGADVHFGLGAENDHRVAPFLGHDTPAGEQEPDGLTSEQLMEYNAYANPSGLSGMGVVNTRAWRAAEIPSTNGHASARGVARVFQVLAAGGSLGGVSLTDAETLRAATAEQVSGKDLILHRPSRFGLGFQLTQPERPLGPNPGAFGHFGAGGSLGFCDPAAGVAFGYVMNTMGPRWQNPRNAALIGAMYASLGV